MKKIFALVCMLLLTTALFCACKPESAYDIAVRNGFVGTEAEWLASLKGTDGAQGDRGEAGTPGADAIAPQIRVNETTNEWEVSTDGGKTWVSTGVKATGEDGKNADQENPQGLDFFLLSDDTYTVGIGKALYAKEITIPATYKGKAVTCVGIPGSIIDDDMMSIGSPGFFWAPFLETVHLPDSITTIGVQSFFNCPALTSITIPASVKKIAMGAFACCENLESLEILSTEIDIDSSAFEGCTKLCPAVPEVTVLDGKLTWAPVDGADYYEIKIGYSSDIIRLTDCEFTAFQEGNYSYSVRAVKGMFYSDWSSTSTIYKLSSVDANTITYENGVIQWNEVSAANSYEIIINGILVETICSYYNEYTFDAGNEDFEVQIRARGDCNDPTTHMHNGYNNSVFVHSDLSEPKSFG